MMIFPAPVIPATIALLIIAYIAFGIPGIVGIVLVGFLARNF